MIVFRLIPNEPGTRQHSRSADVENLTPTAELVNLENNVVREFEVAERKAHRAT